MFGRWGLVFCASLWVSSQAFVPSLNNKRRNAAPQLLSRGKSQNEQEKTVPSSILITFDLDDTLFPIQPVVQEANNAQIKAMRNFGYTDATMEQCTAQTKAIRQALTSPITYTDLRKGAIRAEIQRMNSNLVEEGLEEQVEHCFEAWLQERHAASERHLFSDAIAAMEELQAAFEGSNLCIAGITNGRGNPLCMTNTMAPFFSFCVSGEDVGVFPHRKPASQIYQAALDRWRSLQDDTAASDIRPDLWFHVGDCLANDVGASHGVGALPIWVAPKEEDESDEQPSWSTATEKDLKERAILMEAARAKVKGQITSLSQLASVIEDLVKDWSPEETLVPEEAGIAKR